MKINYELNKKINYEINNFIRKYLYNFNDYNNILDLFDKYIKDNDYLNNCYENIYNKIETENYDFNYKELEIIKKELKEIIIDLLNNDISYKVNLMNNILNNNNYDYIYYSFYTFNEIDKKLLIKYIDKINTNSIIEINLIYDHKLNILSENEFNINLINLILDYIENLNYYLEY